MPWDEFCNLLSGLGENTPLVRLAQIRKETDPKVMEHWTSEQKEINRKWKRGLDREHVLSMSTDETNSELAQIESLFRGMMKK
jgi:hypothetical protein